MRDPADRRRSRVTTTAAGAKALAKADALADEAFDALFGDLSRAELRQLRGLFARGLESVKDAGPAAA